MRWKDLIEDSNVEVSDQQADSDDFKLTGQDAAPTLFSDIHILFTVFVKSILEELCQSYSI